jgi:3-isopropylmalate/(R)-2-methylmalate dehydratase small subunit
MGAIVRVEGRGIPLRGHDIDTDRILPARFLRAVTFDGIEQHVFEDDRRAAPHPFDDPRHAGAAILIVNSNFGCGSSREHAPQALRRWGITTLVGESFAEIFFGNAAMIGLPCVTASPADIDALLGQVERAPDTAITIDLAAGRCLAGGRSYAVSLPANVRDAFLTGAWDTTGMLLERYDDVDLAASRLPYVRGF